MTSSSTSQPEDTADTTDAGDVDREPAPAADTELGLDQIFELLKNQRRRYVMQYLKEIDSQATTSDLAEQIAAWENDKELRRITSDERKRTYVGLYQVHLPKMDDMGVVSFNQPRGTIEPAEHIDHVYAYVKASVQPAEREWSQYYVGLSAASLAVFAGAAFVEAATATPAIAVVAGLSLLAFLIVTVAYYRTQRREGEQ